MPPSPLFPYAKGVIQSICKLLLTLGVFFALAPICHRATDGFAHVNIYAPPGDNTKWKQEPSLADKEVLKKILKQPFHYLSCGSQCYVFLAQDGKTVLKFFKFQHMRIPPWIHSLPLPKTLDAIRTAKEQKKRFVLEKTFNSFHLAYHQMREESALLYIHLAKTKTLNHTLTFTDKMGKSHRLNLDEVEFVLQKRADLAYETIAMWMKNKEVEKAKKGIHALLTLTLKRCQKGIFDKDPNFETNFGFIGETAVQIDLGRLSLDPRGKKPIIYRLELLRITHPFQEWIEKNHPDLLPFFKAEIKTLSLYS